MKCKRCGKELEKNARFCVNCGNEVNNQKEPKQKNKGILLKIIIVEIVCILAVVFGLLVIYFLPKVGRKLNIKDGYVTRYEWMEMLCEQFNIEDSEAGQLTFSDVDDNYEDMISNAYGWGIISGKGKFKGDEPASGEFIAITAIRAIGESEVKIYLEKDELKDKDCINLAIEKELLQKNELKSTFTKEECEKILERTSQLSLLELIKDDYLDIEWQDNVVLLDDDAVVCALDEETIEVRDEVLKQFQLDDVLVFKVPNSNIKRSGKVEKIEGNTIQVSQPDVNEIAKRFTMSDIGTMDFQDVMDSNGFTEENAIKDIDTLGLNDVDVVNPEIVPLKTYERNGFSMRVECNPADGENTLFVTDNETGAIWAKDLGSDLDEESQYFLQNVESLSAQITIDDILTVAQCEKNILGQIEYYKIQVDTSCNLSADASFKVEKKGQRLQLMKIPIKMEGDFIGICAVNIPIYLVMKADGTFAIESEIPVIGSVYYEKGRGFHSENMKIEAEKVDLTAEIELQTGVGLEAYLSLLGGNIADMEIEALASAKAKTVKHFVQEMTCTDLTITFPIIKIYVGGDDESVLNWCAGSWEYVLIAEDKPLGKLPLIWNTHLENNGNKIEIVDACTYNEEENGEEQEATQAIEDTVTTENNKCQYWFSFGLDGVLTYDGSNYYAIGTLGYNVDVPYSPLVLHYQLGDKLEICGQNWMFIPLNDDDRNALDCVEDEPTRGIRDAWRKLKCEETDEIVYMYLAEIRNPETQDVQHIDYLEGGGGYQGYYFYTCKDLFDGGSGMATVYMEKDYRLDFAPNGMIEFGSEVPGNKTTYSVSEYYENPVQDYFGNDLVNPCLEYSNIRYGWVSLDNQNRVSYYEASAPIFDW